MLMWLDWSITTINATLQLLDIYIVLILWMWCWWGKEWWWWCGFNLYLPLFHFNLRIWCFCYLGFDFFIVWVLISILLGFKPEITRRFQPTQPMTRATKFDLNIRSAVGLFSVHLIRSGQLQVAKIGNWAHFSNNIISS